MLMKLDTNQAKRKTQKAKRVLSTTLATEVVTVTPDVAKAWLEKNTNNRRLNDRYVRQYANDMRAYAWPDDGSRSRFLDIQELF